MPSAARFPFDLQGHYGRTEVVKALGTSDRCEAEQLCRVAGAKLDEEFAKVRRASRPCLESFQVHNSPHPSCARSSQRRRNCFANAWPAAPAAGCNGSTRL
ncbi:DUF6538 domain-containing protein [Massilia sp.]|uniref:DUF6538 domain-containing protein n=1 Tax=Massilia sp. TaxID=1882437 RepID=UPI00391731B0